MSGTYRKGLTKVVSGEPTQGLISVLNTLQSTIFVAQLTAAQLNVLCKGESDSYLASDEDLKTENDTASWSTYHQNSGTEGTLAADAIDFTVGAFALEWTLPAADEDQSVWLVIDLGTANTFDWADLISIEFHWKQDVAFIGGVNKARLRFSSQFQWKGDDSGVDMDIWINNAGKYIENNANYPAAGAWSGTRLKWEQADFTKDTTYTYDCDDELIRYMLIKVQASRYTAGTVIHLDGLRIKIGTGGAEYMKVDSAGHLQVDVVSAATSIYVTSTVLTSAYICSVAAVSLQTPSASLYVTSTVDAVGSVNITSTVLTSAYICSVAAVSLQTPSASLYITSTVLTSAYICSVAAISTQIGGISNHGRTSLATSVYFCNYSAADSDIAATQLWIQSIEDNTSDIFVGSQSVDSSDAGWVLYSGAGIILPLDNTNDVYFRASAATQYISWMVLN
jgi:hypothetical protein